MANEQDPIQGLVAGSPSREDRIGDDAIRRLFSQEQRDFTTSTPAETPIPDAPMTFQQDVEQGFKAGIAGLQSSGQYFKALAGTLAEDDKMVADSISRAARYDDEAAQALAATTQFKEFWDAPTFEGGIEQVGLALGQVAPTAVTTIAGALITGGSSVLAQLAGKGAISGISKYAARRVVKEAVENVVQDVATPDEKTLVNSLFKTFKRGAMAGAFGSSYVPLSGQNFSEGLQSGREPDADLAVRSLLVAAPQAALDVTGEALLLRSFANVAKRKAAESGTGILAGLAKDIGKATGKGALVEGVTEAGQEGIGALNRASMDETFTAQDGWMRVAQGAFMGAVGGAGMGGIGGTTVGSLRAAKGVMDKANQYLEQGRQQQADQALDQEQYGTFSGYTTEEPQADIQGQLDAMFNKDSAKTAVWVAGDISPSYRIVLPEDNTVYPIEVNGKRASAAFIPGRGVIIGRKQAVQAVQAVVDAGASDQALQTALGYSALKPDDSTLVVQALDEKGRVISEEATNAAGLAAATAAATALSPNSTTRTLSLKDALADRKRRLDAERGPVVTPVQEELPPEDAAVANNQQPLTGPLAKAAAFISGQTGPVSTSDVQKHMRTGYNDTVSYIEQLKQLGLVEQDENTLQVRYVGPTIRGMDVETYAETDAITGDVIEDDIPDTFGEDTQSEFTEEVISTQEFAPRNTSRDSEGGFANTQETRDAFVEAFGDEMDIDFNLPFYNNMSESLMRRAIELKDQNPDTVVSIREVLDDELSTFMGGVVTGYKLSLVSTKNTEFINGRPIFSFLWNEIRKAKNSKFASERVQLVQTVGGRQQTANVNLVDLINAGKRLNEVREDVDFEQGGIIQSARKGLASIMSELIDRGYDIKIDGKSIFIDPRPLTESDVPAAVGPKGVTLSLKDIFARSEAEGTTSFVEAVDPSGKVIGSSKVDSQSKEGRKRQEKNNQSFIASLESKFPELGVQLRRRFPSNEGIEIADGNRPEPIITETQVESEFQVFRQDYVSDPNSRSGFRVIERVIGSFPSEQEAQQFLNKYSKGPRQLGLFEQEQFGYEREPTFEIRGRKRGVATSQSVSDTERFGQTIEDDPGDGVPLSRLNLEDNPRYQSRARGGRPEPERVFPLRGATYPAGSVGDLAVKVINLAISVVRLSKPVSVFGVKELSGMSLGDIRTMFNDARVANEVIRQLVELRDNPAAKGRYIGFNDAHFILVDNRAGNQLEVALTTAHELGHAVLEEERNASLSNGSLRSRLEAAFTKAKDAEGAPEAYQGDLGFEEWYADQVAIWAQKLYLSAKKNEAPAKGRVENYFKAIAKRIKRMFDAMSAEMRRRFGKGNAAPDFVAYMDTVVVESVLNNRAAYQRSAAREATYEQKAIVRDLNAAMPNRALEAANRIKQQVLRAIRNPRVADAFKFIRTADGILRSVSPEIANMFYTLAQGRGQGSNIGFLRASTVSLNRFMNRVENILGTDWDTQEVRDALTLAASDAPTASLTGDDPTTVKARQIRNFLEEVYDTYIKPTPGNTIAKRENYWPVALDLQKIYTDPEAFIELIKKYDPNASEESIRRTVDGLVAMQQHILDDGEITIEGINPAGHVENARKLTDLVPQNELKNFTLPPNEALTRYLKHIVKRIEFNKATRDSEGNDILGPAIGKLSPENRAKAKQIIDVYLGYNTDPLSPLFKTVNSWGQFIQMVTLLPLATLSSLPELAGAVINAKEFGAVTMAFKEIIRTVKNRQEAMELARDIGVSASNTMSNIFMNEADAEFLDANARKLSDAFFKYIGLNFFTRFTREFASNMGVSFILSHAHNKSNNPRSSRYLADLGLTADEVKAWERNGRAFTNETGEKVRSALQKFVESSMLRPNAAERPIWASDPRWALVWQLKGYFYSFGKVTLGGIKREMTARTAESGGNATAALTGIGALMALTAVAYLPLAMLGLELREYAKYGIAWVLPGVDADANRYFKSDRMDWAAYTNEMFDRAGLFGPAALLTMAGQQAEWGQSAFASLLGPSAETVEDVFREGWEVVPNRLLPVYSLVY